MIQRKTVETTRKKTVKNEFVVDGKKYKSKVLYDAHLEFAEAVRQRFIQSFNLDDSVGKKSRYTSYKPVLDDIKFDSLMEARFYIHVKQLEQAHKIRCLELQPSFTIQESFTKNGKKYRPILYIADFRYQDVATGQWVIVDVKGKETVEFKLKQKLFEYKYPDLSLSVVQLYNEEWLTITEIRKRKRKTKK